jgi:hypothetical protein
VGGAGADPVWTPLANTPLACPIDQLTNASKVRAFGWEACPAVSGCERTVMLPVVAGANLFAGAVEEEPTETRVIVTAQGGAPDYYTYIFFANQDGWLLEAYRTAGATKPHCTIFAGGARGTKNGALVSIATELGGLLHTFGDPAAPVSFDYPQGLGAPTQRTVSMGTSRWVIGSGGAFHSISTTDGTDLTTIATASSPSSAAVYFDSVDTNGASFMFGQIMDDADGGATGMLVTTDGKAQATPFVVPSDGSVYDWGAYAGTYIAWLKGIGYVDVNQYQKMEVWASPYGGDAGIAPFKVDDYSLTSADVLLGGAGRAAAIDLSGATAVWDLATKQRTLYDLPSDIGLIGYLGLTSKYLWVSAGPGGVMQNQITTYVRFALP